MDPEQRPASGEGYESTPCRGTRLLRADNVQWVRATFESFTPGAKDWDLNIQQFFITTNRRNAVDHVPCITRPPRLSSPRPAPPAASATSIADLKDVLIGVQAGTTLQFASDTLEPAVPGW